MGKRNQMGKGDLPKPGKTEIVVKVGARRAPKRKNFQAGADESNQPSDSQLSNQGSRLHSDVAGGSQMQRAGALGQRRGMQENSEGHGPDQMEIESQDLPGTCAAASHEQRSGINDETGASLLDAINKLTAAFERASLQEQETRRQVEDLGRRMEQFGTSLKEAVDGFEGSFRQQSESMANTSSAVREMQKDVTESKSLIANVDSILEAISNAVQAVRSSLSDQSSSNTVVFMGQAGSSGSDMEASTPHASTSVAVECPTEYCKVTINGQTHSLLLTHTEMTVITAATSLREFIRRILCKYYTVVQLQKFTLKGVGAKREPRPMLPGWLVELIIRAAGTWRPFPTISPEEPLDGPLNTAKKLHEQHLSGRVRRLISDILQYFRETRDNDGQMRRRQPPVGGAHGPADAVAGEDQDDESGEDENDHAGDAQDYEEVDSE